MTQEPMSAIRLIALSWAVTACWTASVLRYSSLMAMFSLVFRLEMNSLDRPLSFAARAIISL